MNSDMNEKTPLELSIAVYQGHVYNQGHLRMQARNETVHVNPHTPSDKCLAETLNKVLNDAIECAKKMDKEFKFETVFGEDNFRAVLWPQFDPYLGNALQLTAKRAYHGYDAKLEILIKGHPMPVRPIKCKIQYKDVENIKFYLGLQSPAQASEEDDNDYVLAELAPDGS